jgi:hypothetical protein
MRYVSTNFILLIIAAVLSLPGSLFISFVMSAPRAKWLSLFGAIIGTAAAAASIFYYITAANPSVDGLSFALGTFFGCSMGAFAGALLVNFLVGLTSRPQESTTEF